MISLILLLSSACVLAVPTSNQNRRILGGSEIPIEDVPYQVSLQGNGEHLCGGSIISPKYIETAAHCTFYADDDSWSIRAGSSTRGEGGQVINVAQVHLHPHFNEILEDSDIAVFELAENLEFNDKVAAIDLPSASQSWPAGTKALASGWGVLEVLSPTYPENLYGVTIELVDRSTFVADYGDSITENMFCAGVEEGGKGPCYGDAGGPLQVDGVLVGVVNWGMPCNLPNYPGIYANVSTLRDFIEDVTGF